MIKNEKKIGRKTLENKGQTLKLTTLGFTLIELLAVIVILAVIALIATPLIMGVISDAKKGAAKDSMYAYIKAVELASMTKVDPENNGLDGTFDIKNGDLHYQNVRSLALKVEMKGSRPNGGSIILEKGRVRKLDTVIDNIQVSYEDGDANIGDGQNPSPTSKPEPTPTERPYVDTWTDWLDSNFPKYEPNGGDFETFENIKKVYPNFKCDKPLEIQARAEKFPDRPIDKLDQFSAIHIDLEIGFVCNNSELVGYLPVCYNYAVKILCRNYE